MGIEKTHEQDPYIHLLSASNASGTSRLARQIPGMPKLNVEAIENSYKGEEPATALVEGEDGTVRYRTSVGAATEQFSMLSSRHLVYSHFLQSERTRILKLL